MEITIHIPCIDNLAKAIEALAATQNMRLIEDKTATLITPVAPTAPVAPPVAPVAPVVSTAVPVAPVAPAPVPTGTPTYTRNDLALAATYIADPPPNGLGNRDALIALLGQFQIRSMQELSEQNFGAFATALRTLGGKI